jgi:hypothetical protein
VILFFVLSLCVCVCVYIYKIEKEIEDTKVEFLGLQRVRYGACDAKTHLDIHLVRITFLQIMNLPTNFAYNEYVNHCLDSTTLKMANNTWLTWTVLMGIILYVAHTSIK